MAQQPNFEARFLEIESRLAALELARQEQETRDIAILARIDGFIDDLRRIERVQMRAFDTLMQTQQTQAADMKAIQERMAVQDANIATLIEAAKDHKMAIESLAAGQQQIIELLTGGKRQTLD